MTKSALTRKIADEWRDVVVVRTARIPHRCVCADQYRAFEVHSVFPRVTNGVRSVTTTLDDREAAETHAAWAREHRPEAEVSIEPRPNPNYRPDCLGSIQPGQVYADYIGEAAMAESGRPYCSRCAPEVWK
jgi:hypothetical protein